MTAKSSIMRTKLNTEANILKYYETLKKLNDVLKFTDKISMSDFARKQKVSKMLGLALQKGGIIKKYGKGVGSTYKWVSITPTREMAIKTIAEIRKVSNRKKPVEKAKPAELGTSIGTKLKLIGYEVKLFWGLIRLIIRPIYG